MCCSNIKMAQRMWFVDFVHFEEHIMWNVSESATIFVCFQLDTLLYSDIMAFRVQQTADKAPYDDAAYDDRGNDTLKCPCWFT